MPPRDLGDRHSGFGFLPESRRSPTP
jgi:hypothetical protein